MQIGPFGFDNTERVKKEARYVSLETPRGNQTYRFEIGQEATSSGVGPLKAGVVVKIVDRYMQNGYCYYRDERGQVHRDKDLI